MGIKENFRSQKESDWNRRQARNILTTWVSEKDNAVEPNMIFKTIVQENSPEKQKIYIDLSK